jgi:hypothetical protein
MFGALVVLISAGVLTFRFRDNGMWANLGLATGLSAGGFGLWQLISFRRRVLELFADNTPSVAVFPPTVAVPNEDPVLPNEDEGFPAHEGMPSWSSSADNWA